ncbi:MAG: hypothetical protein NTW78_04990 [Campylobacterales bacterium]|nr:hypothetical protein [Campylobacterales bacterium]
MVKKVTKFLGYFVFFILALMYFAPKVSLYYFLESRLAPFGIIISTEDAIDRGFTLDVNNANVSFKSIESANIAEINVKIFALYNAIDFKNITLSAAVKSFVPLHVESANVKYTILNPLNLKATLKGEFGEAEAEFNISKYALHLELLPSDFMLKEYKTTLQTMKKNESGRYLYDQNI